MMMTQVFVLLLGILFGPQRNGDIAKVSGTVINTATNQPLDSVQVRFKPAAGVARVVLTTRDGEFVITDLLPDTYEVTLSRANFVRPEASHGPRYLKVKPGDDLKDLRFELTPGSVITGRILDQNAVPLVPAIVLAMRVEYLNGRRVLLPGGLMSRILYSPLEPSPVDRAEGLEFTLGPPQVTVNEKGEYRLFGLETGEYYVAIWQKSGDSPTADLPPIYYPGVADPAAAIPVRIRGNQDVSGIDIRVAPIQGHVVRFSAILPTTPPFNCALPSSSGRFLLPVQRTFILVQHAADLDIVHFSAQRLPGRDDDVGSGNIMAGRFHSIGENQWETSKLAPGSYEIYHSFCLAASIGLAGRTSFEIKDRDVEGGTITLSPSVTLRGRVRNNPGSLAPLGQVLIRMRPTDWRGLHPGMAPNPTPTQRLAVGSDGNFAFERHWNPYTYGTVAPGHYQIDVAGLPPDVYVSSMTYGAKEVRDSGIDINGEPESELEIRLDSPGATIAGVVKNNKGGIVPDAKVALVSQNSNVVVPLSPTRDSDQDGTFSFQGVAPGNYAVFAWTAIPKGAWNDPKFLEPFQSQGKKVQAEKGSTVNIELKVISAN
jgi:hypothetical protein